MKLITSQDLCLSSLHHDHANLFCIVSIFMDVWKDKKSQEIFVVGIATVVYIVGLWIYHLYSVGWDILAIIKNYPFALPWIKRKWILLRIRIEHWSDRGVCIKSIITVSSSFIKNMDFFPGNVWRTIEQDTPFVKFSYSNLL